MFIVFDTETTSIPDWSAPNPGMSRARIIQFACILLTPDFDECASFYSIIKLPPEVEIHPKAFEQHGISFEYSQKYVIPIESALSIFDEFAKHADFVVAHNLKFDTYLLSTEMMITGRPLYNISNGSAGICTMLASTKICNLTQVSGKPKWPKLKEAAKILLGVDMINSHDALYDCRITGQLLKYLLQNNHISIPKLETSQG